MEVVGSVVGGLFGSSSSSKAAKTQAAAADRATDLQREQFDRTVELNEPFRQGGLKGQNRLMYLLGLDPGMESGASSAPMESADAVRARLSPQFTKTTEGPWMSEGTGQDTIVFRGPGGTSIDEAGLSAAVQAEMARLGQQQQSSGNAMTRAMQDPAYGSLMRDFGMADYQKDPGYDFRFDEGIKALQRGSSAGGRFDSGRTSKDLMRFGQGLAHQEYGDAFNRFQVNRSNKLNPLQSLAGVGQSFTNATTSAGQNYATGAGDAIMGGANARAAGYVGGANAINSGIGQGISAYQNTQMLNMLRDRNWGRPSFGTNGLDSHFFGNGTGGD